MIKSIINPDNTLTLRTIIDSIKKWWLILLNSVTCIKFKVQNSKRKYSVYLVFLNFGLRVFTNALIYHASKYMQQSHLHFYILNSSSRIVVSCWVVTSYCNSPFTAYEILPVSSETTIINESVASVIPNAARWRVP